MTNKQIQALGNFLNYYQTDLNYIKQFQDFKLKKITPEKYIEKVPGSFYSFLIEFRVIRNLPKLTVGLLLIETLNWVNSTNADDVDLFAHRLAEKGITKGVMTSMASKILFLNNPWKILPMDRLARSTLNQNQNNYSLYCKNIKIFINENESIFNSLLNYSNSLTTLIHKEFSELNDLDIICKNRIIDKILWTLGK
jgi:hypothetical protein